MYSSYLLEKVDEIKRILKSKEWISSYQLFLQSIKEKSTKYQEGDLQSSSDSVAMGIALRILDRNSHLIENYYSMSDIDRIKSINPPKSTLEPVSIDEFPPLKQPHFSSIPGDYSSSVDMKGTPSQDIIDNASKISNQFEIPFSHLIHISIENRLIYNSEDIILKENTLRTNYQALTSFKVHDSSYVISRNTAGRSLQLELEPLILEIVNSTILRIKNKPVEEFYAPTVLFHPDVVGNLISNYFASTSLKDKLGQHLWSSDLQLYDDPLRSKGYYSTLFDDEGSLARPVQLISDGEVVNYLKDAVSSNWKEKGNGYRSDWYQPNIRSYHFPISPTPTNLVVKGGTGKGQYYTDRPGYVLVVRQGYGYPGIGSEPSDFLLHVSEAEIWKDGEPQGPIANLTIQGNLDIVLTASQISSDENIVVNRSIPGTVYTGWLLIPPNTVSIR